MSGGICTKCKVFKDKLWDMGDGEKVCTTCHDLWLEGLLNNPNMEPILRLNKFADDIGFGQNDRPNDGD